MVFFKDGVMANNMAGVETLGMGFLTACGDDLLALLNVGGVNYGFAKVTWNLVRLLLRHFVALLVMLIMALGSNRMVLVAFMVMLDGLVVRLNMVFLLVGFMVL